ncbi:MAG: hypothetical protein AAFR51_11850 [Pseudomonadota bacterium]
MFRSLFLAAALTLAACETVPATMDPVAFDAERAQYQSMESVALAEKGLEALLARPDLTPAQRAETHFLRAEKRLSARFDLPGAIADFEAFAALLPEDPRVSTAERRKGFARAEIESAQRRLAQLQNLSDWFGDKVLMGDLDAGAARYRKAGITPNAFHHHMLRENGYICAASDLTDAAPQPVHQYGEMPDYALGTVWCSDPKVS